MAGSGKAMLGNARVSTACLNDSHRPPKKIKCSYKQFKSWKTAETLDIIFVELFSLMGGGDSRDLKRLMTSVSKQPLPIAALQVLPKVILGMCVSCRKGILHLSSPLFFLDERIRDKAEIGSIRKSKSGRICSGGHRNGFMKKTTKPKTELLKSAIENLVA